MVEQFVLEIVRNISYNVICNRQTRFHEWMEGNSTCWCRESLRTQKFKRRCRNFEAKYGNHQARCEVAKQQNAPIQVKGGRIRRHSSYEPNLDDILEEDVDGNGREHNRDLAEIHRERARNSRVLKKDREGRTWRKRHFVNNNYTRPRSYTA